MTNYLSADERRLSPTEQTIWSADSICSMNFLMHFELRGLLTEKDDKWCLTPITHNYSVAAPAP